MAHMFLRTLDAAGRSRTAVLLAVLLLLAPARNSNFASSLPDKDAASAPTVSALSTPVLGPEAKGPMLGLLTASSIDDKGQPVKPRFMFEPDDPQIAVTCSDRAFSV